MTTQQFIINKINAKVDFTYPNVTKRYIDNVTSIRCIDETNENQFWSWDEDTSPMMNALSKKQLENDKDILSKH